MKSKSSFLTFVLSWLPGLGHLYLGLNRRGLQFMVGFFACVALIPMLPTVFPFALAILWFYSLFDALQKVELVNKYLANGEGNPGQAEGQSGEEEKTGLASLDSSVYPFWEKNSFDPLWIGALCVLIGVLVLIRQALPMVWDILMRVHFGSILLALVLIGFGIWLIRGQRAKKS